MLLAGHLMLSTPVGAGQGVHANMLLDLVLPHMHLLDGRVVTGRTAQGCLGGCRTRQAALTCCAWGCPRQPGRRRLRPDEPVQLVAAAASASASATTSTIAVTGIPVAIGSTSQIVGT